MVFASTSSIEWIAIGALLLVLAFLIGYQKRMGLIAGYDPEEVEDKDGLARLVGGMLAVVGVTTLAIGVAIEMISVPVTVQYGFIAFVVLVAGGPIVKARQY